MDEDPTVLYGRQVDAIGWVGAFVPRVHLGGIHTLLVPVHLTDGEESVSVRCWGHCISGSVGNNTYNVWIKWLHIDVSDGAAGERPHLGFVFKSSSDL